ncbi:MFS transporter [Pseudobacillus badius]|uniref:MFS transporter n=1 Tax=Bacillus badius TaxID=1455 RepID=UPI0007B07168|nr:MFS transporter [Bacillus badius]KZN98569.1 permease [Bacillus badius]OCS83266.1 permease [Bacillus badius]OVE51667.1 MFS transporter [Bacillus badius]TDW02749.1 MFS transporter [Bacillus badius]
MKWKNPLLLLVGIGISNVGAWVYLIALNLIILDMTGSPLAVSILYILLPLAALFTNVWSGTFIDRLNARNLMIFLDFIRALFIFTLPFLDSLFLIYFVVFIINIASSIFEPASMVYMTKLISKTDRQRFNAMRNFIHSCGFILGPSIAGFLFIIGSPYLAIQMNSIALFLSAIVLLLLPNAEIQKGRILSEKMKLSLIYNDWKSILKFSRTNMHVTLVYLLFSVMTVFMTALDSLEAAFATEVLTLSESTYGFLVSIAGVGIIGGSLVNAVFANQLKLTTLIGLGAFFTPIGYIIFAFSNDFIGASIGFFTLTFFLSFANTGFLTFYQNNVPVDIMGRFSSILGILEACLIIVCTVIIGLSAELFDIRPIYIIGSFAFLILGLMINFIVSDRSKRSYYERV